MTELQSKTLAAIADLCSKHLDANYRAISRKSGSTDYHGTVRVIRILSDGGLVEVSRTDGVAFRYLCFRPTAAGWQAAGVTPPMGLETV